MVGGCRLRVRLPVKGGAGSRGEAGVGAGVEAGVGPRVEAGAECGAGSGSWDASWACNPGNIEKYSFTPPKSAFWAKTAVRLRFAI